MRFTRKNIRLSPENYAGKRAYFVTICCDRRRPFLRDAETVSRLLEALGEQAMRKEFAVHAYCFMPDHLHVLIEGVAQGSQLLDFINGFKQQTAFEHRRKIGGSLWQFKFYDHILRRADAVEDVACYIWMNPVRTGLCSDPRDFPFSGSLTLPWKERPQPGGSWMPPWKEAPAKGLEMPG